jgi:hypothetical protein
MSTWFERLAERRMLKARAEGQLQGLAGEGAPLPKRPEAALVDPGEAVGFRIMAEHGAVPEEIALKRELAEAKAAYAAAGEGDKRALMARIAELDMKIAIAIEARKRFMG